MNSVSSDNKTDVNGGTMSSVSGDNSARANKGTMSTVSGDNTVLETNEGIIRSVSGDNRVQANQGVISSVSGDVSGVLNTNTGKIKTTSGDVRFDDNIGIIETVSGDISLRANNGAVVTVSGNLKTEIPPIHATLEKVRNIIAGNSVIISGNGNVHISGDGVWINGVKQGGGKIENSNTGKLKVNNLEIDIKTGNVRLGDGTQGKLSKNNSIRFGEYDIWQSENGTQISVIYKNQAILYEERGGKIMMVPVSKIDEYNHLFG